MASDLERESCWSKNSVHQACRQWEPSNKHWIRWIFSIQAKWLMCPRLSNLLWFCFVLMWFWLFCHPGAIFFLHIHSILFLCNCRDEYHQSSKCPHFQHAAQGSYYLFIIERLLIYSYFQLVQRCASSQALATDLKGIAGNENVSATASVREQHSHDESYHAYVRLLPSSTDDHSSRVFVVVMNLMLSFTLKVPIMFPKSSSIVPRNVFLSYRLALALV